MMSRFGLYQFIKIIRNNEKGGVALEYVMVTIFAMVVGVSILGASSKIFKDKIEALARQAGVELEDLNLDPFGAAE